MAKVTVSGRERETGRARANEIFPGARDKNSERVVASDIFEQLICLMVFEKIGSVKLGFILFCTVSVSLFLAESCNFIAMSGCCHHMLSVVCNASVLSLM